MKTKLRISIVSATMLLAACAAPMNKVQVPELSVNDQMITIVTPATNRLWGVEDPQTDMEWKLLDEAAVAVIDAFIAMKEGGSGPNDVTWAANADWDAFSDEILDAGEAARAAIANRDLDALFEANDVLYPPCENCHLRYHPGLKNQGSQ